MLAATTSPECATRAKARQIPVINDVAAGTLTAQLQAAPKAALPDTAESRNAGVSSQTAGGSGTAQAGSVYVMTASAASTSSDLTGSFAATDLKPSGTWQVGPSGGAFSYSVPIAAPPPPGGQGPQLSLDYSSSSVDSLTSYTNNQAGWVGMGWELGVGFIERHYKPCNVDSSTEDPRYVCWDDNNDLTLSVAGRSSRIVKDTASGTSGAWRTEEDYGWKIEQLDTGSDPGNPGQRYWRVTTQDGTVYRFGQHRDASFQVPYLAKKSSDPCYAQQSAPWGFGRFCRGPWRWMLDQEIDPKGNVIDYSYSREQGRYCAASNGSCPSSDLLTYDRGGYLAQVAYGSNVNVAGSAATGRVVFSTLARGEGVIGGTYKDFPFDLICDDPGHQGWCLFNPTTPSFFVTRRLNTITTQTWNPSASGWDDVTRWELGYRWVQTKPGQTPPAPVLWLDSVRQVGLAGGGPEIAMPPLQFDAVLLLNQDAGNRFPRIAGINNGLGGRTEISYGQPSGCDLAVRTLADVRDRAGYDCYWVFAGESGGYTVGNVYNKWLVTTVTDKDLVAGSPDMVTRYEYVGSP
ncbi:SpvB/TcaC N-terminal domain-containing protein, partial [Sphaerimonospora mesophila]|uniref:SpvB/TcaC N-terminal domain-containing protein n=1 Tax=Sphaerimonospora mesophila TaxID=37483 RepID=UPI00228649A4